jgi:hypothetical protein
MVVSRMKKTSLRRMLALIAAVGTLVGVGVLVLRPSPEKDLEPGAGPVRLGEVLADTSALDLAGFGVKNRVSPPLSESPLSSMLDAQLMPYRLSQRQLRFYNHTGACVEFRQWDRPVVKVFPSGAGEVVYVESPQATTTYEVTDEGILWGSLRDFLVSGSGPDQ